MNSGPDLSYMFGKAIQSLLTFTTKDTTASPFIGMGVKQPRNPWSDGPAFIAQCPIQPGTNFTYEVIFSDEEGTLWWHAHSNWTRQSIHGAIVIHPAQGTTYPYPTPDEEVVVLGDWFDVDVNAAIEEDSESGGFPNHAANAYTINGEPGDVHSCSNETMYRLQVDYGKTYLLRLVNVPMDEFTFFAITGHNLTVVGTDGEYTKPIVTSYVAVWPPPLSNDNLFAAIDLF